MKDSAEQVSQLLFGEIVLVKEKIKNWLRITTLIDNYDGWIDEKQISYLNEDEAITWQKNQRVITKSIKIHSPIGKLEIPIGSYLSASTPTLFNIGKETYRSPYKYTTPSLLQTAKSFLNTPYLWGGKSNYGIDCSGFTQIVFRSQAIELPRDASQQVHLGQQIIRSQAKAGDVAFFTNDAGRVIHVGILLSKNKIIHASGRVKIDKLDDQGIWSEELASYSHSLFVIKRY
jgi:cell wall-associated NlpC family hydrolase